jgi:hypothetical protein
MKKVIIILIILLPLIAFGQDYCIELVNGYKTTTTKIKFLTDGYLLFQDVNGIHKEKRNKIKSIKPCDYSKDKFIYNQLGLTPFVVVKFDSISKEKLFKLTNNWIKETYKNPDKVIKAIIENNKIRINGYSEFGFEYTIVISFKDNKYKFEPIEVISRSQAGEFNIPLDDGSIYYKKNGWPKKMFQNFTKHLGDTFENLNNNLKKYILNNLNNETKDNDDW